jgi:hypothetical protein
MMIFACATGVAGLFLMKNELERAGKISFFQQKG